MEILQIFALKRTPLSRESKVFPDFCNIYAKVERTGVGSLNKGSFFIGMSWRRDAVPGDASIPRIGNQSSFAESRLPRKRTRNNSILNGNKGS